MAPESGPPPTPVPVRRAQEPSRSERRALNRPIVTDPTLIDQTAKASATVLYTVPAWQRLVRLNRVTVTSKATSGTFVYAHAGVWRVTHATSSTWEPFVSLYLDGGDPPAQWEGTLYLTPGDKLVAYADNATRAVITFAIDDVSS